MGQDAGDDEGYSPIGEENPMSHETRDTNRDPRPRTLRARGLSERPESRKNTSDYLREHYAAAPVHQCSCKVCTKARG